jgi:toxin ParE1/3/4
MTKIVWTEPAVTDLQAIVDYIARDSDVYASAMAERILIALDSLADFPRRGRTVPEAKNASVRELLVASYRVMYRTHLGAVEILAIIHGARDVRDMKRKPRQR